MKYKYVCECGHEDPTVDEASKHSLLNYVEQKHGYYTPVKVL